MTSAHELAQLECETLRDRVRKLELENERLSMRPTTSTQLECEGLRKERDDARRQRDNVLRIAEDALAGMTVQRDQATNAEREQIAQFVHDYYNPSDRSEYAAVARGIAAAIRAAARISL